MNSPTNLDTLLKEILITPLVGAMVERGITPPQSLDMVTLARSLCFGPPKEPSQESFVSELLKRPMSTWSDEEMHRYSVATDQTCPECGLTSGDKCRKCDECGRTPATYTFHGTESSSDEYGRFEWNQTFHFCGECFAELKPDFKRRYDADMAENV